MFKLTPDLRDIKALIKRIGEKKTDYTPVTRAIAGVMLDAVEENFAQEGRPVRWQPLADSTKEKREEKGTWPGKILQDSGQLAASIQPHHDRTSALVGTNKPYARIQHLGGWAGRGHQAPIPQRFYMHLTHDDVLEIEELLADWLDNL